MGTVGYHRNWRTSRTTC